MMNIEELLEKVTPEMREKLKTPPSVLRDNIFNKYGLVESDNGLLVPAYIANGLLFNFPGRHFLENYLYPKLRSECGVLPLCPGKACNEYLDLSKLNDDMTVSDEKRFWEEFHTVIPIVNYGMLIPKAKFMIIIAEGHAIDEGAAAEAAHFFDMYRGCETIAIRSDIRLAENRSASINPAVSYFFDRSVVIPDASERAYIEGCIQIKQMADDIRLRDS